MPALQLHVMYSASIMRFLVQHALCPTPWCCCCCCCSQVYFTGGFNRWAHKRQLGPAAMRPPGLNGRHWQVLTYLLFFCCYYYLKT
jgi:hypothetical protein